MEGARMFVNGSEMGGGRRQSVHWAVRRAGIQSGPKGTG